MAEVLKRSKPLAVNPLKAGQPLGAALALVLVAIVLGVSMGMNRYIERKYRQVFV